MRQKHKEINKISIGEMYIFLLKIGGATLLFLTTMLLILFTLVILFF